MERSNDLLLMRADETLLTKPNKLIHKDDLLWCVSVEKTNLTQLEKKFCILKHKYYGWIIGSAAKIVESNKIIAIEHHTEERVQYINVSEIMKLYLIKKVTSIIN